MRLKRNKRWRWAASLLMAVLPASVLACGVCIEDKVAATYDYKVVAAATANKQAVLFFELSGAVSQDPKLAEALAAAAAKIEGVAVDSVRVSLQPAAISLAIDTQRHPLPALQASLSKSLLPWRLEPKLLRSMENGKMTAP